MPRCLALGLHVLSVHLRLPDALERQVQLEHVDLGLTEEAELTAVRVLVDQLAHGVDREAALAATRSTCRSA